MTGPEFSNQFDVLFNNITSNQAPGLDSYEKSVFLTKAQDELILNYFNSSSKGNHVTQGYDDSAIRQSDYSNLIKVYCGESNQESPQSDPRALVFSRPKDVLLTINEQMFLSNKPASKVKHLGYYEWYEADDSESPELVSYWQKMPDDEDFKGSPQVTDLDSIKNPEYSDIYELVEHQIFIPQDSSPRQVIPITYTEYLRLMSKPFKEPLKWQAWRLITNNKDSSDVEIIMTSEDRKYKTLLYNLRYIKHPKPIILEPFEDTQLTLGGCTGAEDIYQRDRGAILNPCELDEIMHEQILQRAVEIAKVTWMGDANQVQLYSTLGQRSE